MSFTKKVKNELARVYDTMECCQLAELVSLVKVAGNVYVGTDYHLSLALETENPAIARKVYKLTKSLFDIKKEVSVRRRLRLKQSIVYTVRMIPQKEAKGVLKTLGVVFTPDGFHVQSQSDCLRKKCCQRAYLRGAFLGCGTLADPERKTYHLEMIVKDDENHKIICELMINFGLKPKTLIKREKNIIYLKESEQIVDFLNIIGAHSSLLLFEGVRVQKHVRNRINRLVNCETANLSKTVDASMKQLEVIAFIDRNIGLENLSGSLSEIARLRMDNPDLSLKELGEGMSPAVSKSGVNHRMRRLQKIAERLEKTRKK